MLWSKEGFRIITLLCVGGMILTSCGFRPQYANMSAFEKVPFDQVAVSAIPDRYGQVLRNSLTNRVGEDQGKKRPFLFEVDLKVNFREIGYEKNLNTSRSEVLIVAKYHLKDRQGRYVTQQGMCRTSEYFSMSKEQIFQNVTSEKNAPLRGLETISRCLTDRLSILLKRLQPKSEGE